MKVSKKVTSSPRLNRNRIEPVHSNSEDRRKIIQIKGANLLSAIRKQCSEVKVFVIANNIITNSN